jgi:hypothetical protein
MCRAVSMTFPPERASGGRGRTWALRVLCGWDLTEPAGDDIPFLVSDLIGNAIAHTATPATLTLAVAEGCVEVAVADTAPLWMSGIPRQAAAVMVDYPACRHGRNPMSRNLLGEDDPPCRCAADRAIAQQPIAKRIWFRRSVPIRWPFIDGCPCGHAGPLDQQLASGHRAIAVSGPWDQDYAAPLADSSIQHQHR